MTAPYGERRRFRLSLIALLIVGEAAAVIADRRAATLGRALEDECLEAFDASDVLDEHGVAVR